MARRTTPQADFQAYFNVADELHGAEFVAPPLTLDDIDRQWVKAATRAAVANGLPWPPALAEAEEFALNHPEWLRGEVGW